MLCLDCELRDRCETPCALLEADLARLDYYQRELVFSPGKLEHLADSYIQVFEAGVLVRQDILIEVRAGLEFLTEEQREVIELYFWKDLNIVEIADMLKLNRSSVQRRLRRGMEALREMVEGFLY